MRARVVVGVLMCIVGGVWFMQGIGVLKGSFMTGQGFWTVVGVILIVLGVRMIIRGRRPARHAAPDPDY
jgi:hypothetical protein